jgi:endonuclease/exonuclease/phosphatase family metal-dependent hydrolase
MVVGVWRSRGFRRGLGLMVALGVVASPSIAVARVPQAPVGPAYRYAKPTGLVVHASAGGPDVVVVNWSSQGAGVHYEVRWVNRWTWADESRIVRVPSVAIGDLWQRTRYYVRVRVVDAAGKPASGWSKIASVTTKTPADPKAQALRVATFNIRSGVKSSGAGKPWSVRRKLVAQTIKTQRLAVVGLQEAEKQRVASGVSQYRDVLNLVGSSWRVTSTTNTAGTRIIYNAKTLTLVSQGSAKLSGDDKPKRYVVWAIFTQQATGREFFFANTHLVRGPAGPVKSSGTCSKTASTKYYAMRKKQAGQVVATIRAHSAHLPVVLTGDMNSHKFHCPNNGPYRVYRAAGLVDPIGNPDRSKVPVGATTEVRIHTQYDSSNLFKSAPKAHGWINGSNVDYIWVSPSVTTLAYETVVKINDATGRFIGPTPSDHNMIRATILIPKS